MWQRLAAEGLSDGVFVLPVLAATAFWVVAFQLMSILFKGFFSVFCSYMDPKTAFIPATCPHSNPPGEAVPFGLSLPSALPQEVETFCKFRDLPSDDLPTVAQEAARYKGLLFDEKVLKWEHDHFTLKKKGLHFPTCDEHWNGWRGFWTEVGPYKQACMVGNLAFLMEHLLCGLILPLNFLYGKEWGLPWGGHRGNYTLSMYGDIGANLVCLALIFLSYATNQNRTLEQYSRAIWPLLIMHHTAAAGMEAMALHTGEAHCPSKLSCQIIISLLGTTGAMHLALVPAAISPLYDNRAFICLLQLAAFLSMVWFRAIYWVKLCYDMFNRAFAYGQITTVVVVLVLILFSLFNLDFVKYHYKALTSCYQRMIDTPEARYRRFAELFPAKDASKTEQENRAAQQKGTKSTKKEREGKKSR